MPTPVAKKEAEYLLNLVRELVAQYQFAAQNNTSTDSLTLTIPESQLEIAETIVDV